MALPIQSEPTISRDVFWAVLHRRDSPVESLDGALYDVCLQFGVNPAVALAFFGKESSFGTDPNGLFGRTLNWGNLIRPTDKSRTTGETVPFAGHDFPVYKSVLDGLADFCDRLTNPAEVYQREGRTTVETVVPRYAPDSDGNNSAGYIKTVVEWVNAWTLESRMTAAPNSAAGAQPGNLPIISHTFKADRDHYTEGRYSVPLLRIRDTLRYIVLHNTEGVDSRRWLSKSHGSGVSAHVLIARDGVRYNIVDYSDTAWHVGKAIHPYRNSNTAGLEFENLSSDRTGVKQPYTAEQINTGAHWVATICFSYGLSWQSVVRHGDIALPAGRRTDPSNFPLDDFKARTLAWLLFFNQLPAASHSKYVI